MKLLTPNVEYNETITLAENISGNYEKQVTFHCYWNGDLNDKQLYSILSCYYFNVLNKKHKIILWLENNIPNNYNKEIEKYAEIKYFSINDELKNLFFCNKINIYNSRPSYYSDVVRYILLYKYGGCWFDLDCLFLRSFDPLFHNFEDHICVYQWENQNYPNGAIYISLEPFSEKMKNIIEFIIENNRGWGFQEAQLTYNLPLDMLVLPCSWFDPGWLRTPYRLGPKKFFIDHEKDITFEEFHPGVFCYHWHGKWKEDIHENSILRQLIKIIEKNIK